MNEQDLKRRTKQFALRCLKLAESLPGSGAGRAVGGQLARCGTSVGANYRAACRARSKAEFVARLGTVEEEADESAYWMELIIESGMKSEGLVALLLKEAEELVRIIARSIQTSRASLRNPKSKIQNPKSD